MKKKIMFKNMISSNKCFIGLMTLASAANKVSEGVGHALDVTGKAISGGNTSGFGNVTSTIGDAVGGIPIVGGLAKGLFNVIGGIGNALGGSNVDEEAVEADKNIFASVSSALGDANSYNALGQASKTISSINIADQDYGTQGLFNKDVDNARAEVLEAQQLATRNLGTAATNINQLQTNQLQRNIAAFGGGINIKPSKRGTFTAAAKKRGMGVQEFASKVLANKEDYSSAMVKKANFARNASRWHAMGGTLFTDYPNSVTEINNGGTHEMNPYDGVPFGIAPDGKPNLVEQGEVIYNDYVFSDRLKVSKDIKERYHLGKNVKTYADAFKALEKESKERPNDFISNNGLEDMANRLMMAQEAQRTKENSKKYAKGGHLFSGLNTDNDSSWIEIEPIKSPIPTQKATTESLDNMKFKNVPSLDYYRSNTGGKYNALDLLRYTSPLAKVAAAIANKKDKPYESSYTPTSITPSFTDRYMAEQPFDYRYGLDKLAAQYAGSRRAFSGPGRNAAILASDYDFANKAGDLFRTGQEYNRADQFKVNEVNTAQDRFKTQLGYEAARSNEEAKRLWDATLFDRYKYDSAQDTAFNNAVWSNIIGAAEDVSKIPSDIFAKRAAKSRLASGIDGTPNQELLKAYSTIFNLLGVTPTTSAFGGKIKTKKRGLTY